MTSATILYKNNYEDETATVMAEMRNDNCKVLFTRCNVQKELYIISSFACACTHRERWGAEVSYQIVHLHDFGTAKLCIFPCQKHFWYGPRAPRKRQWRLSLNGMHSGGDGNGGGSGDRIMEELEQNAIGKSRKTNNRPTAATKSSGKNWTRGNDGGKNYYLRRKENREKKKN